MFILARAMTYGALFVGVLLLYLPSALLSRSGIVRPPRDRRAAPWPGRALVAAAMRTGLDSGPRKRASSRSLPARNAVHILPSFVSRRRRDDPAGCAGIDALHFRSPEGIWGDRAGGR